MTTEQRRALENTIPTTEVIRDAVTFPRDRLGEPMDISGERFDAWLSNDRADTWEEACEAIAWALANGSPTAAVGYVAENNPYRKDSHDG